jgi:hypothetical protein
MVALQAARRLIVSLVLNERPRSTITQCRVSEKAPRHRPLWAGARIGRGRLMDREALRRLSL